MLEIGSLIDGKYKILSEIGHGGMSVVYMAINERANKTWAVKEVRKDGVLNFETVKQGLVVEIDLLKRLHHPNLPSIVDVIESEETFLIVMDYIEGNSLHKLMKSKKYIEVDLVVQWARQLCDVLGYLHSRPQPIIYRDMKPANIILKPDGNVVLIDFGTAREFKEKNLADTTCLGTIGYAAPEQFGGMGQSDVRTDIFGLGATMYHLLTGHNPSKPPYEMHPIGTIRPEIPQGLEYIVEKCTKRNPEERYQSAEELMYDLEHYQELDDSYKKAQKRKLVTFLVAGVMSFICIFAGYLCQRLALEKAANTYQNLLEEATKATDYQQKRKLYEACIQIPDKGGEPEAYLGLIQMYKENDAVFTVQEAEQITKYMEEQKSALQVHMENYVELCFQVGKLYWYYFDYGEVSENPVTRARCAAQWFQDVLKYASPQYEHYTISRVYADIGVFYRDIAMNIIEASDKGEYKALFENLWKLLEQVATDGKESEIVRLELLEFAQNTILQYASKLKSDGISRLQIEDMVSLIEIQINQIFPTTEKTKEKKEGIQNGLDNLHRTIEVTFDGGESQ